MSQAERAALLLEAREYEFRQRMEQEILDRKMDQLLRPRPIPR